MRVIDDFHGEHFWLDNFFIEPDGTHVEGEFQQAKCAKYTDRKRFDGIGPGAAKALGNSILLRADWEKVKFSVMLGFVRQKFKDHPELAAKLIATGNTVLIEGNTWNDRCWGVCGGRGKNWLGKILMLIRAELIKEGR